MFTIRRLGRKDTKKLIEHFQRLGDYDRYKRFFAAVSDIGIETITRRFDWGRSLLVGAFNGELLVGVAELGWGSGEAPTTAEIAMSVDEIYRNRGLASFLVGRVCSLGKTYGVEQVYATWVNGNDAVDRIMKGIGATTRREGSSWRGEGSL